MPEKDSNWDRQLDYVALTDIGMRRSNNQDAHSVVPAPDLEAWKEHGHFFMVADGMGAHAAGELASKLTVDGVAHRYRKYGDLSPPESLERAVVETNSEVHRRGQENSDFHNMGTTASVLVLLPQGAIVAHVGDSRVYRLRDGTLEQLTFDHSLVWELKRAGQLTSENDAAHGIPKNVITRSVGPNPSVQVDIEGPFPIRAGDVFLVCSDGLTGRVEDRELAAILANLPVDQAAQLLVDLANLRGGPDNITLIAAKVLGEEIPDDIVVEEPLRIGRSKQSPDRGPVMWVIVGVTILVAVVLSITDRYLAALAAALLGGSCWLVSWIAGKRTEGGGMSLSGDQRLGGGPYTRTASLTVAETAELLSVFAGDLRERELTPFPIDWSHFDELLHRARDSHGHGGLNAAIADYARAVRVLTVKIRECANHQASDSALDL
jgi:serine/threonine protein phosphatase PrpC